MKSKMFIYACVSNNLSQLIGISSEIYEIFSGISDPFEGHKEPK